ncbi:AlkZ-related protein [Fusibacter bizertensis]
MSTERVDKILHEIGFIMLNQHNALPSIVEAGETWEDLIELIRSRKVFLCKLIDKKTTLLSRELYFALKKHSAKLDLSSEEEILLEFIIQNEPVSTDLIRLSMPQSKKEIDKLMVSLQSRLLVTVVDEGKRLTKNWGTYLWGTSTFWEKSLLKDELSLPQEELNKLIMKMRLHQIDEKYIFKLIGKNQ